MLVLLVAAVGAGLSVAVVSRRAMAARPPMRYEYPPVDDAGVGYVVPQNYSGQQYYPGQPYYQARPSAVKTAMIAGAAGFGGALVADALVDGLEHHHHGFGGPGMF
jgi:hypothetical protein